MLKITDVPIQTLVIRPWKSREAISAGNLELESLFISVDRNEVRL